MKIITALLFLATVCLCAGSSKDTSAPPDKAAAKPADRVREAIDSLNRVAACSDGTIYVAAGISGKVLWLVNGKAGARRVAAPARERTGYPFLSPSATVLMLH